MGRRLESFSRRAFVVALLTSLPSQAGCEQDRLAPRQGRLVPLTAAVDSPLFVLYPSLDRRVEIVSPRDGKTRKVLYLDRFRSDLRAVRDLAVDPERLYALTGSRCRPDDPRLMVVDHEKDRLVAELSLEPSPDRLVWAGRRRLLVGHGPGVTGPVGRLTVIDTAKEPRVVGSVPLGGGFVSAAVAGQRAFVLERTLRARGKAVIAPVALVAIDLAPRLAPGRRMALPPGARQVVLGPTGLLYVSHASGAGTLETDGTITVIDPEAWRVVERMRPEMAVRAMAATGRHLLLNLLSRTGEAWLSVVDRGHRTVYDFRLPTLSNSELVVAGARAFTALRRGGKLAYVEETTLSARALPLAGRPGHLAPPAKDGTRTDDRPGLLRSWIAAPRRAQRSSRGRSKTERGDAAR